MGKYDTQIRAAKKIGEDWVHKAKHYEGCYTTLKKEFLVIEKGVLKNIQKAVQDKEPNLGAHLPELEKCKAFLNTYMNEGKKFSAQFETWALEEPRKNMGFIAEKLKLGAPTEKAYQEVSKSLKTQLTEVATALAATQRTWRSDLKIALENQLDKLEALEKIIKGEELKTGGFLVQFRKGIERFSQECEQVCKDLKVEACREDIVALMNGNMAAKSKVLIEQKYHLAQERIALIPKLSAQIDKNYNRVIKSVPSELFKTPWGQTDKKKLATVHAQAVQNLTYATKMFESAKKLYEEKHLV